MWSYSWVVSLITNLLEEIALKFCSLTNSLNGHELYETLTLGNRNVIIYVKSLCFVFKKRVVKYYPAHIYTLLNKRDQWIWLSLSSIFPPVGNTPFPVLSVNIKLWLKVKALVYSLCKWNRIVEMKIVCETKWLSEIKIF